MNLAAYLVICDGIGPELAQISEALEERGVRTEELRIGSAHSAVTPLLKEREAGAVFIPGVWSDMFCVKVVNGVVSLKLPFVSVIYGPQPSVPNLVTAFNAGLSAFLEVPWKKDLFDTSLNRIRERLSEEQETARGLRKLKEFERGGTPAIFSPQIIERDRFLAKAFMDQVGRGGPPFDGNVTVLLVSSSHAQRQLFESFLRSLGIKVAVATEMAEAVQFLATSKDCRMVISDNTLPDGDAVTLVEKARKVLALEMPRFVVVTSSPEKASELLEPETHIDDVILKPAPDEGMGSILPTIIAGIYQTRIV